VVTSQLANANISDSEWLCMNARGFGSYEEASQFAENLRAACEVSSVAARIGIDTGTDVPTFAFGQILKDSALALDGIKARDNIHGIDVFVDDPAIRFGHVNASLIIRSMPNPFLSDLEALHHAVGYASPRTKDIVLLLNYALMRPEPVAQIVFAISAVEMLGQDEVWSSEQKQLLDEVAIFAQKLTIGSDRERTEVAEAIRKGVHKLSLRQGVLRLLSSPNLDYLKLKWDDIYSQRSTLVHGLAPKPGADYTDLAFRTVSLCGKILLAVVAKEIAGSDSYVGQRYEV